MSRDCQALSATFSDIYENKFGKDSKNVEIRSTKHSDSSRSSAELHTNSMFICTFLMIGEIWVFMGLYGEYVSALPQKRI